MKAFGNIAKDGQVRAVASGALTDGKPVILNSDGTVSVVSSTSVSESVGSLATFESASTAYVAATFDSSNNKVVVLYADGGNSDYPTFAVGTVSGTSISFGTPVVAVSRGSAWHTITFDTNSNKVVGFFTNQSDNNKATGIVGTVSGTTISFGSDTTFSASYVNMFNAEFDSINNKVVFQYRDGSAFDWGSYAIGTVSGTSLSMASEQRFKTAATEFHGCAIDTSNSRVVFVYQLASNDYGYAVVGTYNTTSYNFGTEVAFTSAGTDHISTVFDSSNNKVVIVYRDTGDSNKGTAIVGTVDSSDNSISFGSEVTFTTSHNAQQMSTVFDTNLNKVLISYRDGDDSNKGKVVVGTVSGTSISFTTPLEYYDASVTLTKGDDGITFDSNSNKGVIVFRSDDNQYGRSKVYTPASTSTNLTSSENFIGFSDGAFADGQNAVINTTNTIDRNQSSLTAGQTLFVQTDGTLGETAASPSVTAGTAISATELLVKG